MDRNSSRGARRLALLLLIVLLAASPASAQVWTRVGIGVSVGAWVPTDDDVEAGASWGVGVSLAPEPGWGIAGNLGWFKADLLNPPGGQAIGTLSVKPVLLGVSYTWMRDRLSVSSSLTAGVSFNSVDLDQGFRQSFAGPVSLDVSNSFAVRPNVEVEYAVAPKLALTLSTGFFLTKPDVELETPAGLVQDEWDMSAFNVFVGVTVYPFRN
ncbi:MAG: outer membrane beta-barrel protein [Vicinamibacteraceae bacterium]|nr:outer membrane beta-barrel protein [Vicinamibacteraceae bacterium]